MHSDWFFFGCNFAIQIISMEIVISQVLFVFCFSFFLTLANSNLSDIIIFTWLPAYLF